MLLPVTTPVPINCLAPPRVPMAVAESGSQTAAYTPASKHAQDWSAIEPLLQQIRQQHGNDLKAIVIYGSWLRGNTNTMLDFYVLTGSYKSLPSASQRLLARALPPNVYQIRASIDTAADPTRPTAQQSPPAIELRAKYALLSLAQFCDAMQHR